MTVTTLAMTSFARSSRQRRPTTHHSLSNHLSSDVALRRSGGWRALKPLVELELWGQTVSMTARRAAGRGRPVAGH